MRIFLAITGVLYALLALWCSVSPARTSTTVGLQLVKGAGQSEFLTVYGGLEMALAILFLWPLYDRQQTQAALIACFVVHACLALFRTLGFFLFRDIPTTTYYFAASEWLLFIISGYFVLTRR